MKQISAQNRKKEKDNLQCPKHVFGIINLYQEQQIRFYIGIPNKISRDSGAFVCCVNHRKGSHCSRTVNSSLARMSLDVHYIALI